MSTDFRVSTAWRDDQRFQLLLDRLGAEGVVTVFTLWAWTALHRPKGSLYGMHAPELARVAKWEGNPAKLAKALLASGFMVGRTGEYYLSNWEEEQAWAYYTRERSERARSAVAKRYAKIDNDLRSTPTPIPIPPPDPKPKPRPEHDSSSAGQLDKFDSKVEDNTVTAFAKGPLFRSPVVSKTRSTTEQLGVLVAELEAKPSRTPFEEDELKKLRIKLGKSNGRPGDEVGVGVGGRKQAPPASTSDSCSESETRLKEG